MRVTPRFAPFRSDASCQILPEGLISEFFVECDPGTKSAPLAAGQDGVPSVALGRTTVPFSLPDVLDVFSLPTDQRLRILISELGIGTAARGGEINAILRRTNPALVQSQRVLSIVDDQRERLATAVAQTDGIIDSLARRSGDLRGFVDHAAAVADTTAQHSTRLSEAIQHLPALLAAVRPGLRSLDVAATTATPVLRDLRAAAPGLTRLTETLPAFARPGVPALRALATAAETSGPALRHAAPVIKRLRTVTGPLDTLATRLSTMLVSMRGRGALEGVQRLMYAIATNMSLEDDLSHLVAAYSLVTPGCIAAGQARQNLSSCNHRYDGPGGALTPFNVAGCAPVDPAWLTAHCPKPPPGAGGAGNAGFPGVSDTGDAQSPDIPNRLARMLNAALRGHSPPPSRWQAELRRLR
jgi:phospholipid/cholesterol/gamma-HCH transport system substrate-binding protein